MATRSTATKPKTATPPVEPEVVTIVPNGSNGHAEAEVVAEKVVEPEVTPEVVTPPPFVFQPKNGDPITVPPILTCIPEGKYRWVFWKLRKLTGYDQPIFWLELAKVSDPVQEQIMLLSEDEWTRFFDEWMASGTGGASLGN
jgi:hypothetical protein